MLFLQMAPSRYWEKCRDSSGLMAKILNVDFLKEYGASFNSEQLPTVKALIKNVSICDLANSRPEQFNQSRTIVVGEKISTKQAISTLYFNQVSHLIQTSRSDFLYHFFASTLMLNNPKKFISTPLPFFLQNHSINPVARNLVSHSEIRFSSSLDKSRLLKKSQEFFKEDDKVSRLAPSGLIIVDELVTNALYNAPVNQNGVSLYKNLNRNEPVTPQTSYPSKLILARDHKNLFIGCEDPFGSVSRKELLKLLYDRYHQDVQQPNAVNGGAGLGVKMIIENSTGVFFVVSKGKRTFVCCSIPIDISRKKVLQSPKNFHFCFFEE